MGDFGPAPGGWSWEKVENMAKAKQTYASEIGILAENETCFSKMVEFCAFWKVLSSVEMIVAATNGS